MKALNFCIYLAILLELHIWSRSFFVADSVGFLHRQPCHLWKNRSVSSFLLCRTLSPYCPIASGRTVMATRSALFLILRETTWFLSMTFKVSCRVFVDIVCVLEEASLLHCILSNDFSSSLCEHIF
jgi:hypothetical protein